MIAPSYSYYEEKRTYYLFSIHHGIAIGEPQANSPYKHRLEAYDRTRWEGPYDYFSDTDVSYVVPDID